MELTENEILKKQLGSFYSPPVIASYVAKKIISLLPNPEEPKHFLDPSVGDGELLIALYNNRKNKSDVFLGVDIDKNALHEASQRLSQKKMKNHLFNKDAVSFLSNNNVVSFLHKLFPGNNEYIIDAVICNPPWGANMSLQVDDVNVYKTAKGQYDSYDIFLESCLELLNDGGVYGFIVPDSIFRKEHRTIRKLLLEETSISNIIRVGEFFFEGVSTSVSLIIGKKGYVQGNVISCLHLSNSISRQIINKSTTFEDVEKKHSNQCEQDKFISDDFKFSIDITSNDEGLINFLDKSKRVSEFLVSCRGVELSKKGKIMQCPHCSLWMPYVKGNAEKYRCIHCKKEFSLKNVISEIIISDSFSANNSLPFISGEDIGRYSMFQHNRIKLGYNGINYKKNELYRGPKILVRKTGVGLTATIDYNDNLVNQVVYILKKKEAKNITYPLELFIAILNSRIITYYIIKKYGSGNWCTHPYLSQEMVANLPVPNIEKFDSQDWSNVETINNILKLKYSRKGFISDEDDMILEKIVFSLFRLNHGHFYVIMEAIKNVERLIPFKRLLNLTYDLWGSDI